MPGRPLKEFSHVQSLSDHRQRADDRQHGVARQQRRRRRFLPNLHVQRFWLESERRFVSLRVSTHGLRTIEKKGIEKIVAELRAKGVEL